jgi:hypothetical protein
MELPTKTNVMVTANINDPSGTSVYNNIVGPISILSGDSVDVLQGEIFSFPAFSLSSYAQGKYTLSYTANIGGTDEYTGDDSTTFSFIVNDTVFSYSKLDPVTMLPIPSNGYRPSLNNSTYSTCMAISHPNASRIGLAGIYFSASSAYGSGIELTGEEMVLSLFRWEDSFIDLNDTDLAFDNLTTITYGYYSYPSDLQSQTVYGTFNNPAVLEDNQRYLACVQTFNQGIYLGHDKKTNYTWNEAYYLQPIAPNESDGVYYASGFGMDIPSSMALRVFDASELSLDESTLLEGTAYPNPTSGMLFLLFNSQGKGEVTLSDLSGKLCGQYTIALNNGQSELNISNLEAGIYILKLVLENGKCSQIRVVKR